MRKGFTLLELLITIGILAILASTAVLAFNPVEYLRQSRDTRRVGDLDTISKAIDLFTIQRPGVAELGTSTVVYVSLPDTSSTCANLGLPALPSPWQYRCSTATNLQKIDGTGWLPINFAAMSGSVPLATLPIDPVNTAADGRYYAFAASGRKYEVFSIMESKRHMVAGEKDIASSDNGDDFSRYEVGSNLAIAPWSFEFTAFPIVANGSKQPGWYNTAGPGSAAVMSDAQTEHFLRVSGQVWYEWQENILYNPDSVYKIDIRARQVSDPTVGGKSIYMGFDGIASNGTTRVNITGGNGTGSQHFRGFRNTQLDPASGWVNGVGYSGGYGSPNGTNITCTNPNNPCKVHANVRYFRPVFLVNYSDGNGVVDIDYIKITKQ